VCWYATELRKLRQLTYHSVQDWCCLHLRSYMSSLVVRRVFVIKGIDVGVVILCPLYPQPTMCRSLVPSLVVPILTVHVWLIILVHVGIQQLPLLNV
jgi:hypothetical protein